jgi:hypothetical protein
LATFIKLLETVHSTPAIKERVTAVPRSIPKAAFADSLLKLYERSQPCVVKDGDFLKANKVNLFVSSVVFVF